MIPNLENKMELQRNRLETWIEKMQGMFKKDPQNIGNKSKNKQMGPN